MILCLKSFKKSNMLQSYFANFCDFTIAISICSNSEQVLWTRTQITQALLPHNEGI